MRPRFEEKTFESYFNTELDRRASIYFPFGQVQEGTIGADCSAFSASRSLMRLLGHPYWFRQPFAGVSLKEIASEMEEVFEREVQNIPNIKVNMLFQYKRPERIASSLGSEWHHWNEPYFRYDIYAEQQELLSHIAARFGTQALVLYASPALVDIDDLVESKRQSRIIERTNFRPAADLDNHHRNTYVRPGHHSIACSQPQRLEPFDLLTNIKLSKTESGRDNLSFLREFATGVREQTVADATFGRAFRGEIEAYTKLGFERHPNLMAILTMQTFRQMTGTQWVLVT